MILGCFQVDKADQDRHHAQLLGHELRRDTVHLNREGIGNVRWLVTVASTIRKQKEMSADARLPFFTLLSPGPQLCMVHS